MANPVVARFAVEIGMKVGQVQYLLRLVKAAVDAQVEEHNSQTAPDSTPKLNAVENYVKHWGLKVNWGVGLVPMLIRPDGKWINLPD